MLNFLYCLDEKYNIQALNSITSLLKNSDENLNIFIIHKNKNSFDSYANNIIKLNNLNKLNIYQFDSDLSNIPNLSKSHVSEATYYRFFIDEYLPKSLNNIIYLDSDIVCLNNPIDILNFEISAMEKNGFTIAAKTEGTRDNSQELFDFLDLKNNNHFNAGMMIINLQQWKFENTKNKLIDILEKRKNKIKFWDQDILNIYFDDNYYKLNEFLNYNHSVFNKNILDKEKLNNVYFLHYSGKNKPWDIDSIIEKNSKYYQDAYRNLNLEKYHVVFNKKYKTIFKFLNILITGKFLRLEYPISYIKLSFVSLFKK